MHNIFDTGLRPMEYWCLMAQREVSKWERGVVEGYSTGFKTLDHYARLVGGQLTVIAARPSMGKTALMMQIVENVARLIKSENDNGCVAVYSAEMRGVDLALRCAGALSGINVHDERTGKGTPEGKKALQAALERIWSLPIYIDDGNSPTTDQMLEELDLMIDNVPVRMMVFDFLELGGDSAPMETMRLGKIAQNLKGIAKRFDIPVVVLSQLNRDVEDRANKMPTLADLRFSGMIEQLADVVIFLMRPEYYVERMQSVDVPNEDKRGISYAQYAKNRHGPVGVGKLAFVKEKILFADLERQEVLPGVRR